MSYFVDGLNYTLSNEDTRVEQSLLEKNKGNIFAIGGSGARVLPLIAQNPKHVFVVDLSDLQLKLVELRYEAAKQLQYDEYLYFFGYRGGLPGGNTKGDSRLELFKSLKLSAETQAFWLKQKDAWTPRGFIYQGRWERHFLKLSAIFQKILPIEAEKIFEAQSLEEQKKLYKEYFKPLLFKSFLRIVASEFVFNKFLYKGHFSGVEGKRSDSRPPWKMIFEEFTRIFETQLVRKNYFFQMLFLGKVKYEEGLPVSERLETFLQVKASKTQVTYHAMNLTDGLNLSDWDFISLSDTISYLTQDEMKTMYETLNSHSKSGCIAVIRSFLRGSQTQALPGWQRMKSAEKEAHALDGTGVYQFQILKKN